MVEKLLVTTGAFLWSLTWTTNAVAMAVFRHKESGGGAAPEIDGPGGVMAVALLVSIYIIVYRKFRN